MRYFIAHLLVKDIMEWHGDVVKDISEKCGIANLHESRPPHITIVPPFETENIRLVADVLKDFAQGRDIPGNFTISDFGRFDDRVVYADGEADERARAAAEEIRERMKEIPLTTKGESYEWHPHVTLANHLSPAELERIEEYVQTLPKPNFVLPFDRVTVLRLDDGGWVPDMTFCFGGVTCD